MKRTEGERHAPQGRARTMSDEQERLVRERVAANGDYTMETVGVSVSLSDVLRELDAERAAHAETKAAWKAALDAHRDRETETRLECMRKLDTLKARLALAEATIAELVQHTEHGGRCVRSTFSAGRPTPNGGYECLYGSTWYEVKPVDRTPACDCGLDAALAAWRAGK